jgi:octaprenyl-diphosphate synthase
VRVFQRLTKGAGETAGAVDRLYRLVEADLQHVNALILERMRSDVPLIPELAGHLVNSGGKRLRPMLTLAAAQLCGYQGLAHIRLATAVEFIHTATLLHDDVVDESELRRGKAAAHVIWGNAPSVLVGDFLFSRSFQLMVETGSLRVLNILSNASAVIAEGEVMQLNTQGNIGIAEDTYLKIIAAKTDNLGIAFQLVDDALDYSGREAMMGKAVGDDFREGKLTMPVIIALGRANTDEAEFWRRTMAQRQQTDTDLTHAIHLIEKHHAIGATVTKARTFTDEACRALNVFPDSPMRRALTDLAEFCISRAY